MSRLRESLFGDWKNKGVALFFAVTIWLVVFQSEKQTTNGLARVRIVTKDPNTTIITAKTRESEDDPEQRVEFDDRVRLEFSGPRRQIQELSEELRVNPISSLREIARDQTECVFSQEDFGFPRQGIQIVRIVPPSIRVKQEEVVTVSVTNMAERVKVVGILEGYEVSSKVIRPTDILLRGPASIVNDVQPSVEVPLGLRTQPFDGNVEIKLGIADPSLARFVRDTVSPIPPELEVSIRLKPASESLSADAVKVTFSVPPFEIPARILVDELTEGMLPVEFFGPKDSISQLETRLREPGFSVTVPVPRFELEAGETAEFTFTEESLELFDFPEIQMRPHASRRSPKRPWTYRIVAEKKEE